jgi:vacuolar-type H+-ATPase subunit I/STV1
MSNVFQIETYQEETPQNANAILSKEEHVKNYLKDLVATEEAMEPFKEHKRDIRKSYIDEGYLTKEEIWAAVRAYRMIKGEKDMDALIEAYDQVKKMVL